MDNMQKYLIVGAIIVMIIALCGCSTYNQCSHEYSWLQRSTSSGQYYWEKGSLPPPAISRHLLLTGQIDAATYRLHQIWREKRYHRVDTLKEGGILYIQNWGGFMTWQIENP